MDRVKRVTYQAISCFTNYIKNFKGVCGHFQIEQDLGFDNLDRIELLLALEEDFDIELSTEDCKKWYIVDDVVKSIIQAGGK